MGQQVIHQVNSSVDAKLVAALCRPAHRLLDRRVGHSDIVYSSDIKAGLATSGVVIDFSLPEVSMHLIEQAVQSQTPALIGTTGFTPAQLKQVKHLAKKIPLLLAPNTSIGVNSTLALLEMAAKMLGKQADIEIIEAHHQHKVDAPSGTAIKMGQTIASALDKELADIMVTADRFGQPRKKGEIGISAIRAGEIIGEHKVMFALANEMITIEHKAQNRRCFAEGALAAAVWLCSQPAGFYTMRDFV